MHFLAKQKQCVRVAISMIRHAYIHKCKEKFVILQSIGIIAIKSSETRAVIYTANILVDNLIPNSVH